MKSVSFLLVLMLALVLAACGVTTAPEAPPPADTEAAAEAPAGEEPATDEPITLRYFMWDPSFEEKEQQMVDKYMAANPNVTVDFEVLGTPDYLTKLSALSAADDLPGVFIMSACFVDKWISDGLLYDIQPYVDADINGDE